MQEAGHNYNFADVVGYSNQWDHLLAVKVIEIDLVYFAWAQSDILLEG